MLRHQAGRQVAVGFLGLLALSIIQVIRFVHAATPETAELLYQRNAFNAVPSFVIIGTAKGGTTDLYAQLLEDAVNQDPARREPPIVRSLQKESNFLTSIGVDEFGKLVPGGERYMAYLRHLGHPCSNSTLNTLSACMLDKGLQQFTVDATPTYLFSAIAPMALSVISPRSKVIAMLREPVERAEMLFRHVLVDMNKWKNYGIDGLVDSFFRHIDENAAATAALRALKACTSAACLVRSWQDMWASGLMRAEETKLFAGGLYRYALASWHLHYLQPGRFMLIESDLYFSNRTGVMDQVTRFLYGRGATPAEQAQAEGLTFWRKGSKAISKAGRNWIMSEPQRARLTQFYAEHVMVGFDQLLQDMRQSGAWVLGFEGEPWTRRSS